MHDKGNHMTDIRLGVDVGGTFTDLVGVAGDGRIVTSKVPSTPHDGSTGGTTRPSGAGKVRRRRDRGRPASMWG